MHRQPQFSMTFCLFTVALKFSPPPLLSLKLHPCKSLGCPWAPPGRRYSLWIPLFYCMQGFPLVVGGGGKGDFGGLGTGGIGGVGGGVRRLVLLTISLTLSLCQRCTATKIPFMYSFSGNCAASVPISTSCACERFIYS
jgi:hypothetical protein